MTVVPAYGRDYRLASAAKADWEAGKDFKVCDISSPWDGKVVSKADVPKSESVMLRYSRYTKIAIVWGGKAVAA